jgi:hypothetical protein
MENQKIVELLQEKIELESKKKTIQADWNEKRRKLYKKYKNPLKSLNSQIEAKEIEINKLLEL